MYRLEQQLSDLCLLGNPLKDPPMAIANGGDINPIGKYIKSAEDRGEILLTKMMQHIAIHCPIDEFSRFCVKLRIPFHEITSNKSLTEHEQLMELLKLWRISIPCSANEAQTKLLHIVDLVDLHGILLKLKAMQVYAQALRL
uniref:Death domain-containing protein n=1 Tax=Ciona savignyi TaxID=51511 RepID=H2Y893_CIOSA